MTAGTVAAATATTQSAGERAAPTRVTLHLHETPGNEAIEQLLRQAGLSAPGLNERAMAQRLADLKVTTDVVDQPFMLALKDLCRVTYLEPAYGADASQRIEFRTRRVRVAANRPAAAMTTRPTPR